jgi:hypothetical protein
MLTEPSVSSKIYLQLLISQAFCRPFVTYTYEFESDAFLADRVYDRLQQLSHLVQGKFSPDEVAGIKAEIPNYKAEITRDWADKDERTTISWWKSRISVFPFMTTALRKIATLHPTSAAAERVFSQLEQVISVQQEHHALGDYLELTLLLRFNGHVTQ